MTLTEFEASTASAAPPPGLSVPLLGLWWDRKAQWEQAHGAAQSREGEADADWVHAYLHRKEGDSGNAAYWYRRAGQPVGGGPLQAEWAAIAAALLNKI